MNEIIWAYDYGARSKKKWSTKHDSILWYAKNPADYTFKSKRWTESPTWRPAWPARRRPPGAKLLPTSVAHHREPQRQGENRLRHPETLGILERLVKVHSRPGDLLLDFFAGSGTLGEAAANHGRDYLLIDSNPEAIQVMIRRLAPTKPELIGCDALVDQS